MVLTLAAVIFHKFSPKMFDVLFSKPDSSCTVPAYVFGTIHLSLSVLNIVNCETEVFPHSRLMREARQAPVWLQ